MEAVADAIINAIIPMLGEMIKDEYNLDDHLYKGIKSLEKELMMMQAALRKVASVPRDQVDVQIKIWAVEVRELSYDMDDYIDDFMLRKLGNEDRPQGIMSRVRKFIDVIKSYFVTGSHLHQISEAVQEAQDLAKNLRDLRQRYELDMPSNGSVANIDSRMVAMYKDVGELVGIDCTRDELIKKLTDEGTSSNVEQLKTISIVGSGGLGKTTLAKAVYDKIKAQFNCAAFVPIGQNPDLKKVLKDILYGLHKQKFKDIHDTRKNEDILICELREFLMKKRYLIIIDDIWNETMWRFIKCGLPKNNQRSRIIITTRNVSGFEACDPSCPAILYKMEPLSEEDSQIIFHRRIFRSEDGCPHELEQVSRDILKKCGGVPLAIITIASILASKNQIEHKNDWLHLRDCMGRGVTEDAFLEEMKGIFLLSYGDLPSHLKPCLLYLSMFPEDFEIESDRLIWMWIAEGLVRGDKEGSRLFEIGEKYFNELINRSLIHPARSNEEGMVESCCVHDMVLELICSVSSEDNFISILDNAWLHAPNLERYVRRLSIHDRREKFCNHQFDRTSLSKVRSAVFFSPDVCDWLPTLSSVQFLRVLDLRDCESSSGVSLEHVVKLRHLRYLGLRGAEVEKLPLDIGKLLLLQTLDVWGTRIEELPASVVQLKKLICLSVNRTTRLPEGMGNVTSLEYLAGVGLHFSPRIVEELSSLTEVRTLALEGWSELPESLINALIESLNKLQKIQNLEIKDGGRLTEHIGEGWMPPPTLRRFVSWGEGSGVFLKLPTWINSGSLPVLSRLVIGVEELAEGGLEIIGMLPALRFFCLWAIRTAGSLVVSAGAFPSARHCRFYGFPTPPCLFPEGAMPRLQVFEFRVEARLVANGEVDCGMGHLPSLENVKAKIVVNGASDREKEEAVAALTIAAQAHPKRPTFRTEMVSEM